jgi:predicted nucleotidyltransferase component of viral defense system
MQNLIKQEQFELEILDRLNSKRLLSNLIFGGGTMLRLCFGLNRFSVDLDFYFAKTVNTHKFFVILKDYLSEFYKIKDSANKFNTLLFEIKSEDYPRSLKIEIRKEPKKFKTETAIAYSRYSNIQVFTKIVSLSSMVKAKIDAFLDRREIRDVFDLEFLLKKGVVFEAPPAALKKVLIGINSLSKRDYTIKLGSILEAKERVYYSRENFKILKRAINEKILTTKSSR